MNNDRFKYRVWLKYKEEYAIEGEPEFPKLYSDGSLHLEYDGIDVTDECILEFCTGLKDKNGKLIFENDKCRLGSGRIIIIEFRNGGFGWSAKFEDGEEYDWIGFSGHKYLDIVMDRIEIIGKIHEEK